MGSTARLVPALVAVVVTVSCSGTTTSTPPTSRGNDTSVTGLPVGPNRTSVPLAERPISNDSPWPTHTIDGRFRGANALGRGDANGDGLIDYVTNYEFDQRYVIAFHPPRGADARAPWSTVDIRPTTIEPDRGVDSENAALADLDGDGNLDVVGVQGGHITPFFEGYEPGVRLLFGPGTQSVADASAWVDAGRIPATVDQGHYLWVRTADVNGDGATDILTGSRVLFSNHETAGIAWIEAPRTVGERRDLSRWTVHPIDGEQVGGHGFVLADLDGDGDSDLVHANADFDTPEDAESLGWYENPGPTTPEITRPWTRHDLFRSPDFYGKPQVVVADLDGDGRDDIITQLPNEMVWLRRRDGAAVTFDTIRIAKDPRAQWLARTVQVADLDGDGRQDIIGMLTHDNGLVPKDHFAVFWMTYAGDEPTADNWTTHVVTYGSGKPMERPAFGEKYDQADITDVDGDGDPDIVANIEEWWSGDGEELHLHDTDQPVTTSVAVVWFENRLFESP